MANSGGSYLVENGKKKLVHRTEPRPPKKAKSADKSTPAKQVKDSNSKEG